MKTKTICVRIYEEQWKKIKGQKLPLSFLIREALDKVILDFTKKNK